MQNTARGGRSARANLPGLLGALAACLAACSDGHEVRTSEPASPRDDRRADVVLITLDTARADRIGAYGYAPAQTPNIDALAARGLLFEQAIAPTPITLPSHASILTGVLPPAHGVRDNGLFVLGEEARLVSEVFREGGYRTGAFVGAYVLDARFGLDQGFDVYRGTPPDPGDVYRDAERPGRKVASEAIDWVGTLAADEPYFAWLHFYDPHFPYAPPKRFAGLDPYDGELAACDAQIGRVLEAIRAGRPDREPVVLVTSDHGEGLGDHGERTHGLLVYQPTLRVPLVIAGPGVTDAPGQRIPTPVSTASVAATLLDAAGLADPSGGLHQSRSPSLLATEVSLLAPPEPAVYFENHLPYHAHRWRASRGVIVGDHKLIAAGAPELYDLEEDPGEARNLAERDLERRGALARRLETVLAESPALGWASGRAVGAGDRALLESLGYLESTPGAEPFADGLPDVRERMGDLESLRNARALIEEAAARSEYVPATAIERARRDAAVSELLARAAQILAPVRERNPESAAVARRLSRIERMRGNLEAAAVLLEEIAAAAESGPEDRYLLALLYGEMGRGDEARRAMQALAEDASDYAPPIEWLARHHCEELEDDACEVWLEKLANVFGSEHPRGREVRRALDARRAAAGEGG